jgi:hypothetical protein
MESRTYVWVLRCDDICISGYKRYDERRVYRGIKMGRRVYRGIKDATTDEEEV